MSINTKIRLTVLASALALAAAAPAAFAQGAGTTDKQGFHTDPPTGSADAPPARHSKKVMEKKIVPSKVAPDTGTTDKKGFHTDPSTGSADAPPRVTPRK